MVCSVTHNLQYALARPQSTPWGDFRVFIALLHRMLGDRAGRHTRHPFCRDGDDARYRASGSEDDMRTFHTHVFGAASAAMLGLLASPLAAQTRPEQAATRASVLDTAREALTIESAPPARSTTERALYWYDNQYVLAKIFGGW